MYIVATYYYNRDKNNTMVADEMVSIVKRINTTDMKRSNVILDIIRGEVVKNRGFQLYGKEITDNDNKTYQRLLDYFHSLHPKEMNTVLDAIKNTALAVKSTKPAQV